MSKLTARVVVSIVIGLAIVFAIFTSVQGASSSAKVGAHLVSGALVNLSHDRFTVSELDAYNAQLDAYNDSMKGRGGCESEFHSSPDL
ncbi:hypothetical protein FBQ81_12900 [Chloroflexi bacterium CFX6]|nr:hypothetical protein [Chloroflexi bacterium CFX6]